MKKVGVIIGGIVVLLIGVVVASVAVLTSMDFNEYKGLIAEEAEKATGRKLVIAGDLNLEISLNPALAVEGVTFANAKWGSRPEMATLKRLEAQVALMPLFSGQVQVERLVLEGLDLLAETDKKGRGNWEFGDGAAKAQAKKAAPKETTGGTLPVVNLVHLKDVKVTYKDGKTGETMTAVVDSLEMSATGTASPLKLKVAGSYNGAPYRLTGQLGSIDAVMGGHALPVTLKGGALETTLGVDGRISKPMEGRGIDLAIKLDIPRPPETIAAAAAIVPALKDAGPVPAQPIVFSGRVQDVVGGYGVKGMKLTIGGNDLSGNVTAYLGGKRPRVDADLASTRFNVDELLPPKEEKTAPAPAPKAAEGGGGKRVFPADPLPLDGLKAADAKVKFKGQTLIAQGMTINDIVVNLTLANGNLAVKPFGATAFDGRIGGAVALDGSRKTPALALDLDIKQVDYGKALVSLGQEGLASGKVDADIDIKGAGGSVQTLMAGLTGKARIVTQGGRIESKALNIVSADVASALPMFKSEGDKDIRCGVIHFDVTKGMAGARAIVFETGGLSVVGTGKVNLATEGLDLRVEPRAKKASLMSLAEVPVKIGGVMADPSFAPDLGAEEVAETAASVVGAVATGGLSLLAEKAVSEATRPVDETDYCKLALAGKKVVPADLKKEEPAPTPTPQASSEDPPVKVPEDVGDAVKGLGEGLGKGLKGLFGN